MLAKKLILIAASMAMTTTSAQDKMGIFIDLAAVQSAYVEEEFKIQDVFNIPYDTKVIVRGNENRSTGYSWQINNECGNRFDLVEDVFRKKP